MNTRNEAILSVVDALREYGRALVEQAEAELATVEDPRRPISERARSLASATACVQDAKKALRDAGIWPE